MSKENYLYKGNVQIYLQGENALLPVASKTRGDQVAYFIGSKKSKLLIRDFRREPIHAAHHARSGVEGAEFADAFNQPAYAEVSVSERGDEPEKIEINLRPTNKSDDFPVLSYRPDRNAESRFCSCMASRSFITGRHNLQEGLVLTKRFMISLLKFAQNG